MTRDFPQEVQQVAAGLILGAGNGLYSVIREAGVTCGVCGIPVDPDRGYPRCIPCNAHSGLGVPLADRVGALVYAIEGDTQVYKIVQNYKAAAYAGTKLPQLMSAMIALGFREHWACVQKLVPAQPTGWAVVPSTRGRTMLRELVLGLGPRAQEVPLRFTGATGGGREVRAENWAVESEAELPAHVVVIDDSWVTGSNAQGVASMLKQSGVLQVSVLAVARVMRPDFRPNPDFIRTRLVGSSFDWRRCPWTGHDCP